MTYSTEILTHFQCDDCKGWWTVADYHAAPKKTEKRYCPHCGNEQSDVLIAREQIAALQEVIALLQERVCVE